MDEVTVSGSGGQTLCGSLARAYVAASSEVKAQVGRSMRAGASWKRIASILGSK